MMCVWGWPIVTVFADISLRCSSDGVNPPRPEDAIQLSSVSAHSISAHAPTHPPPHSVPPAPERIDSLASRLSPYSIYSPTYHYMNAQCQLTTWRWTENSSLCCSWEEASQMTDTWLAHIQVFFYWSLHSNNLLPFSPASNSWQLIDSNRGDGFRTITYL